MIRSVWDEPRPSRAPQRVWRDWVLVGVLVLAAVLEGVLRPDLPWRAVAMIVTIGLVATLLWRRTRPLLMVVIAFGITAVVPLPAEPYTMVFMLLLPYALVRWGSGREVVAGLLVILANVSLTMFFDYPGPADATGAFAVLGATIALGLAFRYRAGARLRELDQIKLREREQLARDLHDTVAHHVSAMAIRAQAGLATAESRPDAATDALRLIEAEASRALAEMRAMVRVLRRDEPAELAPALRIAELEQHARFGPSVQVEIHGDLDDLPPSVGAAIYHLAQESVTNARRHARHATLIEVRVATDDTSVHLRVSDDGDPNPPVRQAAGYGLIGMIERTDLLGGTCQAGPNPDRGWTVTAVLPRTAP